MTHAQYNSFAVVRRKQHPTGILKLAHFRQVPYNNVYYAQSLDLTKQSRGSCLYGKPDTRKLVIFPTTVLYL